MNWRKHSLCKQYIQVAEQCHHFPWPVDKLPKVNLCTLLEHITMAVWPLVKCKFRMAVCTFRSMDKKSESILKLKFWLNLSKNQNYQIESPDQSGIFSIWFSSFILYKESVSNEILLNKIGGVSFIITEKLIKFILFIIHTSF